MTKFTKEFKEKAIKLKKEGIPPNDIFKKYGIEISGKQKEYARKLIARWRSNNKKNKLKQKKKKGTKILTNIKKQSDTKRIEYLEAKVAYLEAENSFLFNLPKKKK